MGESVSTALKNFNTISGIFSAVAFQTKMKIEFLTWYPVDCTQRTQNAECSYCRQVNVLCLHTILDRSEHIINYNTINYRYDYTLRYSTALCSRLRGIPLRYDTIFENLTTSSELSLLHNIKIKELKC